MPNSKFDSKSFNPQAFKYLVGRVPNLKMNEIKKSKALVSNPDIRDVFASQDGTAYARLAMRGLADGAAVNYDGQTDIEATSTKTFEQGVVVVGRAKGWIERDFSYDVTGGVDFMENIAQQIAEYKDGLDQDTLLAILEGIFKMTGTKNEEFVTKHTYDVTDSDTGKMAAGTLNTAIQQACGDNKKKFSLVFMHSAVATNLENLNLLEHLKYTDKEGVTRELDLGTWNGRLVVIDDALPYVEVPAVEAASAIQGVYTITIKSPGAAIGDKIKICGKEYTCTDDGSGDNEFADTSSATTLAGALKTLLDAETEGEATKYTWTNSGGVITATEKSGGVGGVPEVIATMKDDGGILRVEVVTTTAGKKAVAEKAAYSYYITYVLGEGAISYEDIGVKVPYEMSRNAAKNGGEDTLYIRQRKCFAPFGISYEKINQASLSPTDAELKDGANWTLVHSGEANELNRSYINHRAIPIARIISKG